MNTNLISIVRAEVERRMNGNPHYVTYKELESFLSFLSNLEKSEKPINPTIEKLRALIKMQIRREELNFASLGGGGQTMNIGALEWVLKQLDTLQEQPVKGPFTGEQIYNFLKEQPVDWQKGAEAHAKDQPLGQDNDGNLVYLKEQPVKIDIRKELASIEFMGVNDARDSETIARHFANIGWNYGYIKGREDAHKPAREVGLPKRFDKQPVCEGLKEEINRFHDEVMPGALFSKLSYVARHFAQWGAEHLKK